MAKKKTSFWKDFKAFITRGNVVDMAVGVVVGGAFSKIVTGLVNYIINPCVAYLTKGGDLDALKTIIVPAEEAVLDELGNVVTPAVAEVAILWGTWIQTIIDFVIVAFCIFFVLRILMRAKNMMEADKIAEEEKKAAEAAKAEEEAKKAAEAAAAEAAALQAKQKEEFKASIVNQETLLAEIRDLLKNK